MHRAASALRFGVATLNGKGQGSACCYHLPVLKIGLTGGIACGKSFVLNEFRQLGVHCIDADDVAHQVILPGEPAYRDIVEHFGTGILGDDSAIDRTKLGDRRFRG